MRRWLFRGFRRNLSANISDDAETYTCQEWLRGRTFIIDYFNKVMVYQFLFAFLTLFSCVLLAVVILKFEKLRNSYRFHLSLICVLAAGLSIFDIIGKSMWVHMYKHFNHTPTFAAWRFAYTVIVMFATENTFEAAMCFLLAIAAAELFVDSRRLEYRHRQKIRYAAAGLAVGLALLLEGSQYFHYSIGPGYTRSYSNCSYAFSLQVKPWAAYGNKSNPNLYRTVYKRYILEIFTVFYPFCVFVALQCFTMHKIITVPDVRREFKGSVAVLFCVGVLVYAPDIIKFLIYTIRHGNRALMTVGWKLNLIIECCYFCILFVFLALDTDLRDYFCELFVPVTLKLKLHRGVNWVRTRLFRHKQFENAPEDPSDEMNTNRVSSPEMTVVS